MTADTRSTQPHGSLGAVELMGAPLTTIVGRETEIAALVSLLSDPGVRLVTLIGPGGVGKTRLASHLALDATLAAVFHDGIDAVPLGAVENPNRALADIADAVARVAHGTGGSITPLHRIMAAYGDSRRLLVLDNFEQVITAATDVADLLAACSGLTILVSSRTPLRIRGEREFPVSPLPIPSDTTRMSLAELASIDAVALFVERARSFRPAFALTDDNAAIIVEICRRLDGLPLALELAAARIKLLTPAAMLSRLENRLGLLTGGARDLPERHQTLRAAIAWSEDLLQPAERTLFRTLAVFIDGWTLDAVEHLHARSEAPPLEPDGQDALDTLAALVDQSLIRQENRDDETRFLMLETVREYALERLTASGEVDAVRAAHADWARTLVADARTGLEGAHQRDWLARLDMEHANLRAALTFVIGRKDTGAARDMVTALWRFWDARGHLAEGRQWIERVLAAGELPPDARATLLTIAAVLARKQGDVGRAIALHEECLAIWRAREDANGIGSSLTNLGIIAQDQADYEQATALHAEALERFRSLGEPAKVAASLNNLGIVARRQGDARRATALYEESLAIWRELGDERRQALTLNNLGVVAYNESDRPRAQAFYDAALVLWRDLGDQPGTALTLANLAEVARDHGDTLRAAQLFAESLHVRGPLGDRPGVAEVLIGLATLAVTELPERATRLLGAADALRRASGQTLPPAEQSRLDRAIGSLRATLGAAPFSAAWQAGALLTFDAARAEGASIPTALTNPSAAPTTPIPPTGQGAARLQPAPDESAARAAKIGLTRREMDVLRLLVEGMSDREIGEVLFISHRTAMTHVTNILNKLGVNSRTAAASLAVRNGIV